MPFYSFHLNVPAQPDVVAERIRRVVSPAPNFWGALASSWKRPQAARSPFLGSVENLSFRIRRNIQYRNSFLPMIQGKINTTPTGARVNVFMYMQPFSLAFMLVWFGFLVLIESRVADMNVARSFFPIGMAIFGLALSLGGFFFEALKVMPLLSEAVFNTEVMTAPVADPESQPRAQAAFPRAELSRNRVGPAIAVVVVLAGFALLYLYAYRLRASPAFATAMKLVSQSAEAKVALGEPIRVGLGVRGTLNDSLASGYAILAASVSGPKGKGTLYVVANRLGSDWDIEREALQTGNGSRRIDLTPPTQQQNFHYPATGRVYLLPLDDAAASELKELPAYYMARLGMDVQLLPTQELGPEEMDAEAKQVIAEKALLSMAENQPRMAEDMDSVMLGVTSRDMNYQTLNLRYGTNFYSGRFSIVSTARFHGMPWYAGSNPEVLAIRTRKMITRNLALLHFPLDRSSDVTSALSIDAYTPSDVDRMGESFGGQDGNASFESVGAPCVTILQGPNGKQAWRLRCINDAQGDGRFERFETYTGVPLFVMSRADFSFKGQPSFPFLRKYRPQDDRSRPFGIGATDSFDIFPVGDSQTFSWIELILAGGERVHFARTSIGTGFANAEYRAASSLGDQFSLSTLAWNGNGWDLATRDGWTYKFPSSGPDRTWQQGALIGIGSASGKKFSIQRNGTSDLQEVRAPGGESIKFTYDAMHRITSGKESSGHSIQYEYDAAGKLVHVRDSQNGEEFYEYDPANRLTAVRDAHHRPLLVNTYGYLGEILSQTLADGEKLLYESGYNQDHKLTMLTLTLPNGYTILYQLTRYGFVRSWPQPPANSGSGVGP
jgi:YD repeat-containing protein